MNIKLILFFLLISLCVFNSNAQDTNDNEIWASVEVKYDPTKKISLSLQQQFRPDGRLSQLNQYFTEFNVGYDFTKKFSVGVGLRYTNRYDRVGKIQGLDSYFRYQFDIAYKQKSNDFEIKYRLRYQRRNELNRTFEEGDIPKIAWRLKVSPEYNFKNWPLDPKLSAEIFYGKEENAFEFGKYRMILGSDYRFKKFGKIEFGFGLEKSLIDSTIPASRLLILNYVIPLN